MKIAYIGYDLSCLKAAGAWAGQPAESNEFVFFLKEKKQDFQFNSIFKSDIYVDQLMISGDQARRNLQAEQKFLSIQKQFNKLAEVISVAKEKVELKAEKEIIKSGNQKATSVLDLKNIHDIQYDSRRKKIILEIEKQGVEEFDLLLVEGHPILADYFEEKKIKIFKDVVSTNYAWSAVKFEIDYLMPVEPFQTPRAFFLVLDSARESFIDNWVFCHIQKDQFTVWNFQPSHQIGNTEFANFYTDRLKQSLSARFKFIYFKNYLNTFHSSVGAHQKPLSAHFPQAISVPNFQFSSGAQVKEYFEQKIIKKLKIIKKISGEKYD